MCVCPWPNRNYLGACLAGAIIDVLGGKQRFKTEALSPVLKAFAHEYDDAVALFALELEIERFESSWLLTMQVSVSPLSATSENLYRRQQLRRHERVLCHSQPAHRRRQSGA